MGRVHKHQKIENRNEVNRQVPVLARITKDGGHRTSKAQIRFCGSRGAQIEQGDRGWAVDFNFFFR